MGGGGKILVTGGAGFIGSNLVEALLERGDEVTVLDDFSTGRRENLAPFAGNPRFKLVEGDIRNLEDCRRAVAGADHVLHEAARGSVPRSIDDPLGATSVNVAGFVNMLYAAHEAEVRRFVYASSSSVYGDSPRMPKVETECGRALSPYAATKQADELFAENFRRVYGIRTVGLRYFNVFGRRQDPRGSYAAVIPKFAAALLKHERPVIYGDGTQSRDFTHVDNVVAANLLAMEVELPEHGPSVCNVACGVQLTLNELFAVLRDELAAFDPAIRGIEPEYAPPRRGDVPRSLASIDLARKLLGYSPLVGVREGIGLTAKWYFENLSANAAAR